MKSSKRRISRWMLSGALSAACLFVGTQSRADAFDEALGQIEAGRFRAAIDLLEPLLDRPGAEARASLLLATACNALGDFRAGLPHAARALELLPESAEAHFRHAQALRIKMTKAGKLQAMFSLGAYKRSLRRAIQLDPTHLLARREEIGFLTFAPGIAGGDLDRARERIAALMPIDWRTAMTCRAELRTRERDYARAVRDYARILERHPDDAACRTAMALLLHRIERFDEAADELQELTGTVDPRGESKYLLRFIENAPDDSRSRPDKSLAWSRLGYLYERLERRAEALEAYVQAIRLDPRNEQARSARRALSSE